MMRSLFSAISGLRSHQTFMDVVGNNIANVNTTGFKSSRVTFQDLLNQTTQGGTAPGDLRGGINPVQVGLGSQIAAITMQIGQGNLQATQNPTDLAIQGNGFFVLSNGQGGQVYTRDGSFIVGSDGSLTNASGLRVMGWLPDPTTGQIDRTQPLQSIVLPSQEQIISAPSTTATFVGNLDQRLDAAAPNAADKSVTVTLNVYDSLGEVHQVTITFTKTDNATNAWSWTATESDPAMTIQGGTGSGTIDFQAASGMYNSSTGTLVLDFTNGASSGQTITLDFSSLTQLAEESTADGSTDGASAGALTKVSIGANGEITGLYSNGQQRLLGQLALASFANPQGLLREGGNVFTTSPNSGEAVIGVPGVGGRGLISSGYLEMSNVDLAQEFTNMILAERGFQASSRVINATDSILQELVNLRR